MLAESAAILEYIANKYRANKPTLFPGADKDIQMHWAI